MTTDAAVRAVDAHLHHGRRHVAGQQGVSVERGQRVDVGDVCKAGLGTVVEPVEPVKPGNGKGKGPKKPRG